MVAYTESGIAELGWEVMGKFVSTADLEWESGPGRPGRPAEEPVPDVVAVRNSRPMPATIIENAFRTDADHDDTLE